MRSAHGAGFLYALAMRLGITAPDVMVGSSDDAGNVPYFSAGLLTRDQKKLQKTFDQGVADALSIEKELREIFVV